MKILKLLLISIGVLFYTSSICQSSQQNATILKGIIVDNRGEAAIGVSLQIENTYEGAYTDANGAFYFSSEQRDSQVLIIYSLEYEREAIPIFLGDTDTLNLNLEVEKGAIVVDEVTVSGIKEFKTSDKQKTNVLNRLEILTIATDANVLSAFQAMPGVQPVGESNGLFIRGGTNNETQTFIDGLKIDKFSNSSPKNMQSSSRFSPNMFQGSFFSSGGYSALYGQATSGALILETTDLPLKSNADWGISPLFVQGGAQKLSQNKRTTYGATFNYFNLGLAFEVFPVNTEFTKPPEILDMTFNFKQKVGEGGMFKYYGSLGTNRLGIQRNDLDNASLINETDLANKFLFSQATYTHILPSDWKIYVGTGISYNFDDFNYQGYLIENPENPVAEVESDIDASLLQLRSVLSKHNRKSKLDFGGEFQHAINRDMLNGEAVELEDNYGALFAEYEQLIGKGLFLRLGLRGEHFSLNEKTTLSPRATATYMFSKNESLYASYGVFYQRPEYDYLYQKQDLDLYRGTHYIAGYKKGNNYRYMRLEAFRKDYQGLVKFSPEINSTGTGYAQGIELYWKDKKTLKVMEYWLSYSYLDTQRDYLDYPVAAQPSFASNHVMSLTLKKYFAKRSLNFGMNYTYASGRPYRNPNQPAELFMSDRTIGYHNLNLNLAYLPKIGDSFSVIVLTVSNLLGTKQVFGYEYSSLDFSRRRAILPTTDRFVFLGFFMNFGIDRTKNIIDRELN